jgi:putative FmdB family regulatory protein
MPVYAFRCRSCEHRFEKLYLSIPGNMESSPPCPQCSSAETVKLVSSFAVSGAAAGSETTAEGPSDARPPGVTPLEHISQWRKPK